MAPSCANSVFYRRQPWVTHGQSDIPADSGPVPGVFVLVCEKGCCSHNNGHLSACLSSTARCKMSAMHWEARRRQHVLDRRMAAKTRQHLAEDQRQNTMQNIQSETLLTPSGQTVSNEVQVVDKRVLCHCQHENTDRHSAKVENRYSSTQYSQQW